MYFWTVQKVKTDKLIIWKILFRAVILGFILQGCSPTKYVPANEYLLDQSTIHFSGPRMDKEELLAIVKQKPNRRILGIFRFHLRMYNAAQFGKKRKWKTWLSKTVGEEPVLLDTVLTHRSSSQLKLFLAKKGYFHATVVDTIRYKNKLAKVDYRIKLNNPYYFGKINYSVADTIIRNILENDASNCLIHTGEVYDEAKVLSEQQRIATVMKNNGYYFFLKEHIYFEADSAKKNRTLNLTIVCLDAVFHPQKISDSLGIKRHKKYYIDDIFIYPNYSVFKTDRYYPDTLTTAKGWKIVYDDDAKFKSSVLIKSIFLERDSAYDFRIIEDTYKRLTGLRSFKSVNLEFFPNLSDTTKNKLDAFIRLTPARKQSYSAAVEGTHSSGNLGVSGNIAYQNRNVFRGAEVFEVKLRGALEVQQLAVDVEEESNSSVSNLNPLRSFNTVEIGPEFNLFFPGALTGLFGRNFSKEAAPRITVTAAFNYQLRPDYERSIFNLSTNYSWRQGKTITHIFQPLDVNFIDVSLDPAFVERINAINDVLIRQSYKPLMIPSFFKYTFLKATQETKNRFRNFFRFSLQTSGNIINAINKWSDADQYFNNVNDITRDSSKSYRWFGIRYSQFVLGEVDYRLYYTLDPLRSFAGRLNLGMGRPYGNSQALPFVKSFFGGGANDIRAWTARTLGPGSFPKGNEATYEQIGDIKIEGNFEYRFKVYKMLNAAAFVDVGNIWLIKPDSVTLRQGGQFSFDRFYKEFAVGTGFGLRVDFSFFIIRLDLGVPVYDPGYTQAERFVLFTPGRRNPKFNLGIGYPF